MPGLRGSRDLLEPVASLQNLSNQYVPRADLNSDGVHDGWDLDIFQQPWGYSAGEDGRGELSATDLSGLSYGFSTSERNNLDNRIGFGGYMWDPWLGAYHVRHRVYDPNLRRWLQVDPIGYAGGDWDLSRYCNGDPVNFVDPMGLSTDPCPIFHHGVPQGLFGIKKDGTPAKYHGIPDLDIHDKEFGRIFEDHGTHMRGPHHTDWNDDWEKWAKDMTKDGGKITADDVREQFKRMSDPTSKEGEKFADWLGKSKPADRSYSEWGDLRKPGAKRAVWEGLDNVADSAMGKLAKKAGTFARKAAKVVPGIGAILGIFGVADRVSAGESLTDAIVNETAPVDSQTIKACQKGIDDKIDEKRKETERNRFGDLLDPPCGKK